MNILLLLGDIVRWVCDEFFLTLYPVNLVLFHAVEAPLSQFGQNVKVQRLTDPWPLYSETVRCNFCKLSQLSFTISVSNFEDSFFAICFILDVPILRHLDIYTYFTFSLYLL